MDAKRERRGLCEHVNTALLQPKPSFQLNTKTQVEAVSKIFSLPMAESLGGRYHRDRSRFEVGQEERRAS